MTEYIPTSPARVRNAVIAILITLAISALGSAISTRTGQATQSDLAGSLFVCAILSTIPYKISNRSNAARYLYLILNVASWIWLIGGDQIKLPKPDAIAGWIELPLALFSLFELFQPDANAWFSSKARAE